MQQILVRVPEIARELDPVLFRSDFRLRALRLLDSKALFICTGALYIGKPDRGL